MIRKSRLLNRIECLERDLEHYIVQQDQLEQHLMSKVKELNRSIKNVLKCPSKYRVGQLHCQYGVVTNIFPIETVEGESCNYRLMLAYQVHFDKDGVTTTIVEKTSLEINECRL